MKKLCNYILFRESNWNGPEADKSGVTCSFLFGSGWFKPEHPADCISFVDIKFRTELEVDFIPFVAILLLFPRIAYCAFAEIFRNTVCG